MYGDSAANARRPESFPKLRGSPERPKRIVLLGRRKSERRNDRVAKWFVNDSEVLLEDVASDLARA